MNRAALAIALLSRGWPMWSIHALFLGLIAGAAVQLVFSVTGILWWLGWL